MIEVLAAAKVARQMSEKNAVQTQPSKEPELESLATKRKATDLTRWTIDQALERLDRWLLDHAKQVIVSTLKNRSLYLNKSFICRVTRNALLDLLPSILLDDIGLRELYEKARVHGTRKNDQLQGEEVVSF